MSEDSGALAENNVEDTKFLVPKFPIKKPSSNASSFGDQSPADPPKNFIKSNSNKASFTLPVDTYSPPSWAETPPDSSDHAVEVMNNGVIAANHRLRDLAKRSYLTIGRVDMCDIQAMIPTASRYHCYLQYGQGPDGIGWYVIDKASTQGTYLNKKELTKNVYHKLHDGCVLQITKSNFHLFFTGTDESKPAQESNKKEEDETLQPESSDPTNFLDELKAKQERSFEKDPLAYLSKFCEREGLEFNIAKISSDEKELTYSFDLPDDVTAHNGGSFIGKGPDPHTAQHNCALQVCRHLNTLGMLSSDFQWNGRKNIAENDYYDEDEDTFYDRTGQLEAQRLKRIQRHKASVGVKEKAMSYEQLLKKIREMEGSCSAISEQIERLVKPQDGSKVAPDEIDVSTLTASVSVRLEVSRLKRKHSELSAELEALKRAEKIAKPTVFNLPTSIAPPPKRSKPKPEIADVNEPTIKEEMIPHSDNKSAQKSTQIHATKEDLPTSDDEKVKSSPPSVAVASILPKVEEIRVAEKPKSPKPEDDIEFVKGPEMVRGPAMPPSIKVASPPKDDKPSTSAAKKVGLVTRKELQAQKNATLNKRKVVDLDGEDEDEEVAEQKRSRPTKIFEEPQEIDWIPPTGQTGDGRTKLNEKLGY